MDNRSLVDLLDHHWLANWYYDAECHPGYYNTAARIVPLAVLESASGHLTSIESKQLEGILIDDLFRQFPSDG